MSSIYRKGRDGYYYYQTYVYNPDTEKNDKRIFHSLGTKDQAEAEKLQLELDLQHDQHKTQPQKTKALIPLYANWKILSFVLVIVIVIIYSIDIFQSAPVKPIKRQEIVHGTLYLKFTLLILILTILANLTFFFKERLKISISGNSGIKNII